MDQSEIKLIYFDSAYYLPDPIPLTKFDQEGRSIKSNRAARDLIHKVFHEQTNRDELKAVVRTAPYPPSSCSVCNINLDGISEVLFHMFSQPHMDKCVKMSGLNSTSGYSFWMRLLKMFPKNRTVSKERLLQELQLFSSTLDLHSRDGHWTVEVHSATENLSALRNFVFACFAKRQKVIIYMRDQKEADEMAREFNVELSGTTVQGKAKPRTGHDNILGLSIHSPGGEDWTDQAVAYLRPPSRNRKWPDGVTAHCAFSLCSPLVLSSLMLINGSDEWSGFRAFENRFMQPRETPLLKIYPAIVLEMVRVEAKTKRTINRSLEPPALPLSIATVSRAEPVDALPKTTVSKALSIDQLSVTVPASLHEVVATILEQPPGANRTRELLRIVGDGMISHGKMAQDLQEDTNSLLQNVKSWDDATFDANIDDVQEEFVRLASGCDRLHNTAEETREFSRQLCKDLGETERGCGEFKKLMPINEEWIENTTKIKESEVEEWEEMFSPFDEEEGKAVEELIESMME